MGSVGGIALAILAVIGLLVLFFLRQSASARRDMKLLSQEFFGYLRRERPEISVERVELLIPIFRTGDGRRFSFLPIMQEIVQAKAVDPESRLPIYRRWADTMGAAALVESNASLEVHVDLEAAIRDYLADPGVPTQERFLERLLTAKLFVPARREGQAAAKASDFAMLVTDTDDGPYAIAFSSPERVTQEVARAHGMRSGVLVEATFVLRQLPEGMGLVINPGTPELLMQLPAEGLARFRRARLSDR